MTEDLDKKIALAELALKRAESDFGLHDVSVANELEKIALLFRERKRILDAVNAEARADVIWNNNPTEARPRPTKSKQGKQADQKPISNRLNAAQLQTTNQRSEQETETLSLSEEIKTSEECEAVTQLLSVSAPERNVLAKALSTLSRKLTQENNQTSSALARWSHTISSAYDHGQYYYLYDLGRLRKFLIKSEILSVKSEARCVVCMIGLNGERLCTTCKPHCYVCSSCGTIGRPVTYSKFNLLVSILLFFCFVLPWFIYVFWCYFTNYDGCKKCKGKSLIPANTFAAKDLLTIKMLDQQSQIQETKDEQKICPFCAEVIKKQAIKCKHCQSDLSTI